VFRINITLFFCFLVSTKGQFPVAERRLLSREDGEPTQACLRRGDTAVGSNALDRQSVSGACQGCEEP